MPHPTSPRTTPVWVKILGAVIIVVLLAFVVTLLAGVQHGPGLHSLV